MNCGHLFCRLFQGPANFGDRSVYDGEFTAACLRPLEREVKNLTYNRRGLLGSKKLLLGREGVLVPQGFGKS